MSAFIQMSSFIQISFMKDKLSKQKLTLSVHVNYFAFLCLTDNFTLLEKYVNMNLDTVCKHEFGYSIS